MLNEEEISKAKKAINKLQPSEEVKDILNCLSDERRLAIFRLYLSEEKFCVTDIAEIIDVSVPAASYQLDKLENANLLNSHKDGKVVCYEINEENKYIESLKEILEV